MISNQEIESYFYCSLKAQYYSKKIKGKLHPISYLYNDIHKSIETNILKKWNHSNLNYLEGIMQNQKMIIDDFQLLIPFIEKKTNTPIYISLTHKISLEQKNMVLPRI